MKRPSESALDRAAAMIGVDGILSLSQCKIVARNLYELAGAIDDQHQECDDRHERTSMPSSGAPRTMPTRGVEVE